MTLHAINPRVMRELERPVTVLGRIGDQTLFYGRALAGIPYAVSPTGVTSFASSPKSAWAPALWR